MTNLGGSSRRTLVAQPTKREPGKYDLHERTPADRCVADIQRDRIAQRGALAVGDLASIDAALLSIHLLKN